MDVETIDAFAVVSEAGILFVSFFFLFLLFSYHTWEDTIAVHSSQIQIYDIYVQS